jgi:hypothetical protein
MVMSGSERQSVYTEFAWPLSYSLNDFGDPWIIITSGTHSLG